MEKTEAMKSKIKSALTYPAAVMVVACVVIGIIMVVVIPAFENVFSSFGADLPGPTLFVMGISEFFVAYWWLIVVLGGAGAYVLSRTWRDSKRFQKLTDRWSLKLPVFGALFEKACIARWTRTLSTMFAAGVPLMEALELAGGTTGNSVYEQATFSIQEEVSAGVSLNAAMGHAGVFPNMVVQMCEIGEESGSLDHMLGKAADFFEAEVDQKVAALASLMEPFIIVVLGSLIGGIVISMYLPIFELGQVI
jgi:type IV pilus assembly protein PilC